MKYLVFMLLSAYPGAIGSVTLPADDSGISSDTEVSFATCTDVPPGAIGVDIFPEVAVVWFSEVLLSVTSTASAAIKLAPPLVCRNKCQKLYIITQASYSAGAKYCSKCAHYFITSKMICECCRMRLKN